jgi:aspartate oxidase
VITKAKMDDCSTNYAQGGIAAVMYEPDNFDKHVRDTMVAGAGYCNEEVVRMVVSEAPARIRELIEMGSILTRSRTAPLIWRWREVIPSTGYCTIRILPAPPLKGAY